MNNSLKMAIGTLALGAVMVPSLALADTADKAERQHKPNIERVAEHFGLDLETLQAELDSGKTIRELGEELGIERPERPERPNRGHKEGFTRLAEALGLTEDELKAAHEDGSIRELIEEAGLELPEFKKGGMKKHFGNKIAEELGLTHEELRAEVEASGGDFRAYLESQGLELPERGNYTRPNHRQES